MDKREIWLKINGKEINVHVCPTDRLIDIIREYLSLTGTKEGCGIGECGACTIIMDGRTVNGCLVLAGQAEGADILTIEGLEDDEIANVIKECFVEEGAIQCGFCTPGFILSAYALLKKKKMPALDEIKRGMSGNLCRCTGYVSIIRAVDRAAKELRTVV